MVPSKILSSRQGPILDQIKGHIEHIIFSSDTGFIVARLKESGKSELTTIVGVIPSLQAGETVQLSGEWKIHPTHGRQFEVQEHEIEDPSDVVGIQKYLESGLVKGIGPIYAKKIVEKFKENTLDVIDNAPHRLKEVEGIGQKRIGMIKTCWNEQRSIRKVMIFLRSLNVSPAYAQKIYKAYGDQSIAKVKAAPYMLAKDIFGIGFKMADCIAQNLGVKKDSEDRIAAGLEFVLWELSSEGHTCVPLPVLVDKSKDILEVDPEKIHATLKICIKNNQIIHEVIDQTSFVWVKSLYLYEKAIAEELSRLLATGIAIRSVHLEKATEWV